MFRRENLPFFPWQINRKTEMDAAEGKGTEDLSRFLSLSLSLMDETELSNFLLFISFFFLVHF